MTTKLEATGQDDFIPEDRRAIYATFGAGNTDYPEVHLAYVDPEDGEERDLGWYRVSGIFGVISEATYAYAAWRGEHPPMSDEEA
jgi:hypothetical protein